MTTIKEILEACLQNAPLSLAEEWDNVGLLVGSPEQAVSRVLLALDVTPAVVREAADKGASLIISHHPVIFRPLTALAPDDTPYLLARHDLAALCLHTNLDRAEDGVNTALADALELCDRRFLPDEFLLTGALPRPMAAADFARFLKERLDAPSVRYTDGGIVSRVALSSGGGGDGVTLCRQYGCDSFVTGELKHHHYLYAEAHGISAFDAGHHPTENVVVRALKKRLSDRFPDVTFTEAVSNPCPYKSV